MRRTVRHTPGKREPRKGFAGSIPVLSAFIKNHKISPLQIMNKPIAFIIAAIVIIIAGYYFLNGKSTGYQYHLPSGGSATSTTTPSPVSQSGSPSPTPQANAATVTISNFIFNPSIVTVKRGDSVVWINTDSAPHTINSAKFNSLALSQGAKFQFTFIEKGTFDYMCGIHPYMKGKIIVSE